MSHILSSEKLCNKVECQEKDSVFSLFQTLTLERHCWCSPCLLQWLHLSSSDFTLKILFGFVSERSGLPLILNDSHFTDHSLTDAHLVRRPASVCLIIWNISSSLSWQVGIFAILLFKGISCFFRRLIQRKTVALQRHSWEEKEVLGLGCTREGNENYDEK